MRKVACDHGKENLMKLTITQALEGLADAESKLSEAVAIHSPTIISENMYRLGQYAAALEKFLGDVEEVLIMKYERQ